jgi:hypothetical protein
MPILKGVARQAFGDDVNLGVNHSKLFVSAAILLPSQGLLILFQFTYSRTASKMYSSYPLLRSFRGTTSIASKFTSRFLSASFPRSADGQTSRQHENSDAHGEAQKSKPLNPHLTNTTSTMKNNVPSVGADKAPPELISSVDPKYVPKDDVPENTERMTGGTQPGNPNNVSKADLGVGEMEGAKFKIEPLRRTGEDSTTMRARLLCSFLFQKAP